MRKIYVGIDPSINSTGMTLTSYQDDILEKELFYIIKPDKLTKKEQKFQNEHSDIIIYILYNKISDNEDSYISERSKILNLINICNNIINIIYNFIKKYDDIDYIYIGMEGLSYGSSIRTRSIYELAGLNFLIRQYLVHNLNIIDNLYIFTPSEIKKFATGIGNCSKDTIINIFKNVYNNLSDMPKIDDVADSWFICELVKYTEKNKDV